MAGGGWDGVFFSGKVVFFALRSYFFKNKYSVHTNQRVTG